MTQEELDALMNGEDGFDSLDEDIDTNSAEETVSEKAKVEEPYNETDPEKYKVSATHNWPPPPPTDENKMVHQLDDVTKESEEKATEIFDIIENISNGLMDSETVLDEIKTVLNENAELFTTLNEKFPNVESFHIQKDASLEASDKIQSLLEMTQDNGDAIMNVMDIMQYQDIHRQKIERVINVMRALSSYMNQLFAGKIDDANRVGSATHLPGDSREDLVDADDIEALLASFGTK